MVNMTVVLFSGKKLRFEYTRRFKDKDIFDFNLLPCWLSVTPLRFKDKDFFSFNYKYVFILLNFYIKYILYTFKKTFSEKNFSNFFWLTLQKLFRPTTQKNFSTCLSKKFFWSAFQNFFLINLSKTFFSTCLSKKKFLTYLSKKFFRSSFQKNFYRLTSPNNFFQPTSQKMFFDLPTYLSTYQPIFKIFFQPASYRTLYAVQSQQIFNKWRLLMEQCILIYNKFLFFKK